MRIAISTSVGRMNPLPEVMREIAAGGFECLEISYYHHKGPDDVAALTELASRLGLSITTFHLPFRQLDISHPDEKERRKSYELLRDYVQAMGASGLKTAIVHPNTYAQAADRTELQLRSDQAKQTLFDLADDAADQGVYLAIENMLGSELRVGSKIADLRPLVDELDSEYVGLCVDTVHAQVNHFEPQDEIIRAGSRLIAVHVSDSINRGHDHLVPNRGELNWDEIITSLAQVDYSGVFTMEVYGPAEPSLSATEELIRAAHDSGTALQKMWNDIKQASR